jgi:glycosyltransferase involved in cell wall biosynthesis
LNEEPNSKAPLKRILYIQYTNPAGYPPLEHSSRILAGAGWRVLFLGTGALGADVLRFPPHPNVSERYLSFCNPGWRQKLHYVYFCFWVLVWTLRWRPRWIYASDPLVCPAALVLCGLPWLRVLYHEHDSPDGPPAGSFQRLVRWTRKQVARRAACCVLPNEARLERFRAETGTRREVFCVWNCPSSPEVAPPRATVNGSFWLLYHGSIVPDRLPLAVVDAMAVLPEQVKLRVIGYETVGSSGYVQQFWERARKLRVEHRLDVVGVLPRRFDLMQWCQRCDAGLAFMPLRTTDANERSMTGASNKPFDYLACGLALLVSDLPDWRAAYVEAGYALACDPQDPESIAGSVRRLLDDPELARSMGEQGRQRILEEWNYEACFLPVLGRLHAADGLPTRHSTRERTAIKVTDTQL